MIPTTHNLFVKTTTDHTALQDINTLDERLYRSYLDKLLIEPKLNRKLVSFQANKGRAVNRWFKYKEAYSASLVEYIIQKYGIGNGTILDPFAGSGTTLFVSSEYGIDADGIELLPIGQQIIQTRLIIDHEFTQEDFAVLERWCKERPWIHSTKENNLSTLRITKGAYTPETESAIEKFMAAYRYENQRIQTVLHFALLCILESISYTRKDGQYLRWDYRSGRQVGAKPFNKGTIHSFDQAICEKLQEIIVDAHSDNMLLKLFDPSPSPGTVRVFNGSCLDVLPKLSDSTYEAIITSPPYCNRYDYTRTYALELALLGTNEAQLVELRQAMLSCTVENRTKDLLSLNPKWLTAITVADNQKLLQAILRYLEVERSEKRLNNNGIPRMIRGYFYEMACIIGECSRVMKQDAKLFMVNDNVRYAGASISVDLILSSMAEQLGFAIDAILLLPQGKGNSSQQMGEHGREELRKCVYVWRKL